MTTGGDAPLRSRRGWWIAAISLAVLAAMVVVGLPLVGERWVERRVRTELAQVARTIGRPISLGDVDLGLGGRITVTDLVIGAAPDGPRDRPPALHVPWAEADLAVLPTVLSLGKRPRIHHVRISAPAVTVVRLRDGRLDWQVMAARLQQEAKPAASEPTATAPNERVLQAVVDEVRVSDGRLQMIDLQRKATAQVSHVDFAAEGVGLARQFEARLLAAVASSSQNLRITARLAPARPAGGGAAKLPLRRLDLRLDEVALAPLAPILGLAGDPRLSELVAGKARAELTVEPGPLGLADGAPAPDALRVRGRASLDGARFAGGDSFDAGFSSDLGVDLASGSLAIRQLEAHAGEMRLEAQGALLDLATSPRFKKFVVRSHGLDFDRIRRYYPALERLTGAHWSGPFAVQATAEDRAGRPHFQGRIDLTDAGITVPGRLTKPAGTVLVLEAEGGAQDRTLRLERGVFALGSSRLVARGTLRTGPDERTPGRFDLHVEASELKLQEVAALLGPQRAERVPPVEISARLTTSGAVGRPATMVVDVPAFTATAGRSRLQGKLRLANLQRPHLTLQARAPYLDLDEILPRAGSANRTPRAARATSTSPSTGDLEGRVSLVVNEGRARGIPFRDLRADLTIDDGRLIARDLRVSAFGGRFSGAGTEVPLSPGTQPFIARGTVSGMALHTLLARFARAPDLMRGSLSAEIALEGVGLEPADLIKTLSGRIAGRLENAQFLPESLLGDLRPVLARAVKLPGARDLLGSGDSIKTWLADRRLGTLEGSLRIADGRLLITEPLEAATPWGPLALRGKIGLGGSYDLTGSFHLAPKVAAALAGGRVRFEEPVPLELGITGPLRAPRIAPANLDQLSRAFAAALVRDQADRHLPQVREKAEKAAEKILDRKLPEGTRERVEEAKKAAGRRIKRLFR